MLFYASSIHNFFFKNNFLQNKFLHQYRCFVVKYSNSFSCSVLPYNNKRVKFQRSSPTFYGIDSKRQHNKSVGIASNLFILNSVIIDVSQLNIKQEDIINEDFLFSSKTSKPSEIESEIEEIEDDEYRYRTWKNIQIGLALGGSAIGMWFAYKGLNLWEKWMKEQEQKDIEEEIQMTGTYINPGARNVEVSIDPITGKKIQLKDSSENSSNN